MKEKSAAINLIWVTNHHTYYHDYLFQRIEETGLFKLTVYYRQLVNASHPWKEVERGAYKVVEIDRKIFGFDFRLIYKAIVGHDYFIIAGWDNAMYLLLITILRLRNRPNGVFSDTPRRPSKGVIQFIKQQWFKFIFSPKSKSVLLVTGTIGVNRSVEFLRIPAQLVRNFPFATNHEIFSPSSSNNLKKGNGPVIFLAVGRIDFDHKGQDIALKAFAILIRKGITNFRYRVAGLGEDLGKLRELESELSLQPYVEHLGWLEIKDLPRVFNEAHFTVHSSHEDPFPNSVLESLSCGVPVISSDAAGSAMDRIIQGINGFLFPDGDVETLSQLLEAAIAMTEDDWLNLKKESRRMALEWPADYNIQILNSLFSNRHNS